MTIEEEYALFKEKQYAGKTREERKQLDQFFTEPVVTRKMLSYIEYDEEGIFDPTCGCGNLLIGAILEGLVKPEKCYGVEIDPVIAEVCRDRLEPYGVPRENIVTADILKLIDDKKKRKFGVGRLTVEELIK